jgi:hypothetical protein
MDIPQYTSSVDLTRDFVDNILDFSRIHRACEEAVGFLDVPEA